MRLLNPTGICCIAFFAVGCAGAGPSYRQSVAMQPYVPVGSHQSIPGSEYHPAPEGLIEMDSAPVENPAPISLPSKLRSIYNRPIPPANDAKPAHGLPRGPVAALPAPDDATDSPTAVVGFQGSAPIRCRNCDSGLRNQRIVRSNQPLSLEDAE